ncbi:RNA polymerase sigma-70 factor, ECF subfamily [Seinonella peptonophila]|uniref:RNA polymerase sigma-70 factor, ECF subfamily n=1 Tax=Seinonella peptonophila TaxID=112248 RepID=A0A1M4ZQD8_9BACL|nr:sigma factor-like helix-turn-helix DNA-binding protein [Seinonella peptonophila]SHF20259.1 RNA polymerase sigma-70 factor, ECF subfamily [Seinonella peptonophila]
MNQLIKEYKNSLEKVRLAKKRVQIKETEEQKEQYRLLCSMERDLLWSIQWMETGRRPGNKRGVERLAAYQQEISFDPIWIQNYAYTSTDGMVGSRITQTDRERIDEALSSLSPLEREVYLMSRGRGISYSEIAMMMSVKKGTVQKMLERAEKNLKCSKKKSV